MNARARAFPSNRVVITARTCVDMSATETACTMRAATNCSPVCAPPHSAEASVNAMTYFIAGRYGRKGIRANAIMPFVVAGKVGEFAGSINCVGRSGTPEEIGEAVVFLCSDRASLITGQVIHLDGGLLVRAPWPQVDDKGRPPPAV